MALSALLNAMSLPRLDDPISLTLALVLPTMLALLLLRSRRRRGNRRARVRVTRLFVYPVKACAGVEVTRSTLTPRGLAGDRTLMVVDAQRRAITQREAPRLVLVQAAYDGDDVGGRPGAAALLLDAPGVAPLRVAGGARVGGGSDFEVVSLGRRARATDMGDAAAAFFAAALERPDARLVRLCDSARRISCRRAPGGTFDSSFADSFPYMGVSEASLMALRADAGDSELDMRRFRPNIVVDGCSAYAEDGWVSLAKEDGSATFEAVGACVRCKVPTVHPDTGEFDAGNEPTETLKRTRKFGGTVVFGQNVVARHLDDGAAISVGDWLDVVERIHVRKPDAVEAHPKNE